MSNSAGGKNRAIVILIWVELACLATIILFFNHGLAITLSSIFLLLIISILVILFISILYKGLGERRLSSVIWFSFISIISIVLLFADLHRWIGIKDTVKTTGSNYPFLDALYFSVVTWTTLGYGDVVPCPADRPVAAIEAVMGYLVMALLIAVLVPILQKAHTRNPTDASKPL